MWAVNMHAVAWKRFLHRLWQSGRGNHRSGVGAGEHGVEALVLALGEVLAGAGWRRRPSPGGPAGNGATTPEVFVARRSTFTCVGLDSRGIRLAGSRGLPTQEALRTKS